MFSDEKLSAVLSAYKEYFPKHWKDERYKWEAIAHFQKHWEINALNFSDMFMTATDKTFNLLANMNNYPRGMIKSFSAADPEAVRAMFLHLFDESKKLAERIEQFMVSAEELRAKYDDGTWRQHYQTPNAITTYLWLRYPDKYYMYKYTEVLALAKAIESDFIPKRGGSIVNVEESMKLYDEIRAVIIKDKELDILLKEALGDSCYTDPEKITMTIDVGFFASRFYGQDKEIDLESLHSDAKFSKWYAPVVETLYKMGGSGRRPEVQQKIIEDYGITEEELKIVNSTGTAQVLNDIDWARNYLIYEGLVEKGEGGLWILTELGKNIIVTDRLAGKITAKWIKIKVAEREHKYVPEIDLTPYYIYRNKTDENKNMPYTKEDFLSQVYMSEERYDTLVALLKNKKNLILQGAPGVGKTFAAKRLAYSVMGEKDYFFIIDEINRGNMSKIFGELLLLIEKDYRGTKATLAYSGEAFSVPENLYIIGMMNTADRSLAMIDYALRRRFSFFEMEPGFSSDGFKAYQESMQNETFNALIEQIIDLNREIKTDESLGEGFRIGHSYFCGQTSCTEDWMKSVIYYDIIPMLQEYWFDDRPKVQRWENLLSGVFND